MGRFQVFAGPTGIRGDAPASWRRGSELHRALLARFEPALEELFPPPTMPGFHTLKLTVHVRNGAAGEGECMVDGRPNARLCQLAREHAWPAGDSDFLFKQYYVLAPARP